MLLKPFRSCFLLVLLFAVSSVDARILIPAPPQIAGTAWILMDANTGKILVEENADQQLPPASLTKMMTSYIVSDEIHNGKLNESDEVLVSVKAWQMGGSKMYIRESTKVPLIDLLRGVIIQSGNDASVALAEHVAGSEGAFADIMNQYATQLGMHNSHFLNATGWPAEGHLTTARDLATLAKALINDHPEHYAIYSEKYFEYNDIKQPNRNRLLWRDPSVDGIKTGHTEEAGYCLVSTAVRDDMRLIAVVMGTRSEEARARESQKLLSYGFRYYESGKVYSEGDVIQEGVRVWYGESDTVDLVVPDDIYLTIPRGSKDQLVAEASFDETLKAPISAGQELGNMTVRFEDDVLLEAPLVAGKEVPEAGLFARLWDWLVLLIQGLLSGD
ncbi:MAG: D-alanyl-D-alanine carboxypeptidase family protein [bacterium]